MTKDIALQAANILDAIEQCNEVHDELNSLTIKYGEYEFSEILSNALLGLEQCRVKLEKELEEL